MQLLATILMMSWTAWADDAPVKAPDEPAATEDINQLPPADINQLPPAPATMGTLTPKRLMALRTYKAQRLQVRAETEYRGSGAAMFTSMSYGYPYGMGTGVVVTDPVQTFRTWGVYRGPQRLSTPDFLTLAGTIEKRDALVTDIKKAKGAARGWFVVAGTGVGGIVAGLVGMSLSDTIEDYSQWNMVSLLGTTVTITGLFGASFPAAKGERLYRYPGSSMTADHANTLAHSFNEGLRQELEVKPEEAWLLDLGTQN